MNVALLDLPIQPTTEVLGFGLGSASSSQHLPFRFYDQCRRGSSDPTVQRSVFASVDKVPGKPAPPCATTCPVPVGGSRTCSLLSCFSLLRNPASWEHQMFLRIYQSVAQDETQAPERNLGFFFDVLLPGFGFPEICWGCGRTSQNEDQEVSWKFLGNT